MSKEDGCGTGKDTNIWRVNANTDDDDILEWPENIKRSDTKSLMVSKGGGCGGCGGGSDTIAL